MKKIISAKKERLEGQRAEIITYKTVDGKSLRLYAYFPSGRATGCVMCIHGGGWRAETPARLTPHAAYFAENGAVGIGVEYRLIGDETDVRDCLKDCVDALVFLRAYLKEKYGDLPITALGDSAGAYLAVCLGNEKILKTIDPNARVVDLIVDLNGIVDLTGKWNYAIAEKDGENKKALEKIFSPLYNIGEKDSPVYILQGKEDKTVDIADAENFYKALKEKGVPCEISLLDGAAHAFILFDYRHDNAFVEKILTELVRKLKEKKKL